VGPVDFTLKDISDKYTRENFFRLQKFFEIYPFFKGNFKHFEFDLQAAVVGHRIKHGLGFKPLDLIQTSVIGSGAVTWLYAEFDTTNLVVTTTGPCKIRAFVGAYREDS
jgi:hypothetical protein